MGATHSQKERPPHLLCFQRTASPHGQHPPDPQRLHEEALITLVFYCAHQAPSVLVPAPGLPSATCPGPGQEASGASAADLAQQGHQGGQLPGMLDLLSIGFVQAPELSQQAQQLRIQKPVEEGVGSPGKQAAESPVLTRCPEPPLSAAGSKRGRELRSGMADQSAVQRSPGGRPLTLSSLPMLFFSNPEL